MKVRRYCWDTVIACIAILAAGCGGGKSGPALTAPSVTPQPTGNTVSVSGTVTDRIGGGPIDTATMTFALGTLQKSASVTSGSFAIDVVPGEYLVTITGPSNVPQETRSLTVPGAGTFPFSVLKWGSGLFGATYDQTFDKFFDQVARVASAGTPNSIRKWVIPPTELYVVPNLTVASDAFADVLAVLAEINAESVHDLWCGFAPSLNIVTGPDITTHPDGVIIVRPNFDVGASGTLGQGNIRSGTVTVNVFGPNTGRFLSHEELKGALLHELYHVAFGFHTCGGDLGSNPHGFSPINCPYPASVMANRGDTPNVLAPQDKLAACIVYHPDTHVGNVYPDVNPTYR